MAHRDSTRCGAPGQVLVVGSINADLVVTVSRLPAEGETVIGGRFAMRGGGKGANQAVAASRAGACTRFVGAVGDDEPGRQALRELRGEGIDVDGVGVVDEPTGVAAIVVDAGGANQIAVASGANARVDGAWVQERIHGLTTDVLVIGHELADDANVAAARHARSHGAAIVLNPAPARALPSELVALAPLLTPNRSEAAALTGVEDPADAGTALTALTHAPVVVTLGREGALLVVPGRPPQPIAAPSVRAVDSTGAGDVLTGTLAAALAAHVDLREAVEQAVAAAAASVTKVGARL